MIYNLKYTTCFGHYLESPNKDKILSGKFVDINEYNKIRLENEKLKSELSYYTGRCLNKETRYK